MPLLASMVKLMGLLPVPAVGFPLSKPPVVKVRPSAEMALAPLVMEKFAAGNPFATNWKLPDAPLVKVVALALVIAGASFTVRLKVWEAGEPTPLSTLT